MSNPQAPTPDLPSPVGPRRICNAQILTADILHEDHGILTAVLGLTDGTTTRHFGMYNLGSANLKFYKERQGNFCGLFISAVLHAAGVDQWAKLRGRIVRVDLDDTTVYRIGGVLTDDAWFAPADAFAAVALATLTPELKPEPVA